MRLQRLTLQHLLSSFESVEEPAERTSHDKNVAISRTSRNDGRIEQSIAAMVESRH